ncbi:nucleotidyltransferase domain-containing protein [Thermococcus sp. SY098]|uniref:nucleotidyltransferase domain-containing protein n=1 Tax=Thermococcus sp. SY098 TaxID=3111325 RepID=UPI002D78798F|nr:nucleotidyltransferase domain-containing protein [Thermococcus sp. SY098]WRS53376.1 nucleotidyltransferase domain-containing protein [Thermococcus sp. SY098]
MVSIRSWLLKKGKQRYEMIKNYKHYLPLIKRACEEILGECEVYVFGSVLEGRFTAGSDVDILIKVKKMPENVKQRASIIVKIEEKAGLPYDHPFELHLVDENGFEWYVKALKTKLRKI